MNRGATVPVRLSHMWRRKGDTVVVFSDAHFNVARLEFNRVGSRVWELIDGERTAEAIVDELAVEFPTVPYDRIATGVETFLEQLRVEWLAMTKEELATYE